MTSATTVHNPGFSVCPVAFNSPAAPIHRPLPPRIAAPIATLWSTGRSPASRPPDLCWISIGLLGDASVVRHFVRLSGRFLPHGLSGILILSGRPIFHRLANSTAFSPSAGTERGPGGEVDLARHKRTRRAQRLSPLRPLVFSPRLGAESFHVPAMGRFRLRALPYAPRAALNSITPFAPRSLTRPSSRRPTTSALSTW